MKVNKDVSIPYRYATNQHRYFLASRSFLFQSLIGTLQTRVERFHSISHFLVSIPYRYATNLHLPFPPIWAEKGFNPL